jgi:endonuclease/exonuclease/phosphatase family metal-dependent hydrolase
VEVCAFGSRIQIINTHLGLTPAARLNQIRVLAGPEWLYSPECRNPVILCGDFNSRPGSAGLKLFEERLNNVEALNVNGQIEKTWPSSHPLLSIDHMFISDDLAVLNVTVPVNGLVRMASDHLPLFVQLSLPDITAEGS